MLRECTSLLRRLALPAQLLPAAAATRAPSLAAWQQAPRSCLSTAAADAGIEIDESVVSRLKELQQQESSSSEPVFLRVEVDGGGCSGFQYKFSLDHAIKPDDVVFRKDGATLLCDAVSLGFLKGAKVEYEDSLMRSAFHVTMNPNSESTCGCGSSFVAKM